MPANRAPRSQSRLSPRKRPVQQRSRETVEAILEAARQVFAAHGYAGGTTNRIAQRAGVSIGSFYQYFPNKDAIVVALMERHMTETTAMYEQLMGEADAADLEVEQIVRHFVTAMLAIYQKEPSYYRVIFEEAPRPLDIHATRARIHEAVAGALATQIGRLVSTRLRHPIVSAHLLVEVATSSIRHFVLHTPPGLQADVFADELIQMILAYLVPPGTPTVAEIKGSPAR
jgi:AcrR family transcriptional regulator